MAEEQQGKRTRTSRSERVARMDKEILDVEGAADVLGVSKTTIYKLGVAGVIGGFFTVVEAAKIISF